MPLSTWQKPLAFTDVETTGLDPIRHEVIEIGLIVAEQKTLKVLHEFSQKVKPEHIETADPDAFVVNGYTAQAWKDAVETKTAIEKYSQLVQDAIFCSWRVAFDYSFVREAFRKAGVVNPLDPQTQIDVYSMARFALREIKIDPFRATNVCKHFGIPEEPKPHRALNGARVALEIYRHVTGDK